MASTNVPDVLRNAADIIDQRGWHQGRDVDPETGQRVCANGAMRLALGWTVSRDDGGFGVRAATNWGHDQLARAGRLLTASHNALSEFMFREGIDHRVRGDSSLPSAIRFNDHETTTAKDVTWLLRRAATWLESAPMAVLDGIEREARGLNTSPPSSLTFSPKGDLVSA